MNNIFNVLLFVIVLPILIVLVGGANEWVVALCIVFLIPFPVSYLMHRIWFRHLLAKDGIRLTKFQFGRGFVNWGTDPIWWQYRTTYNGLVDYGDGRTGDCSMAITGPVFALVASEMSYQIFLFSDVNQDSTS